MRKTWQAEAKLLLKELEAGKFFEVVSGTEGGNVIISQSDIKKGWLEERFNGETDLERASELFRFHTVLCDGGKEF